MDRVTMNFLTLFLVIYAIGVSILFFYCVAKMFDMWKRMERMEEYLKQITSNTKKEG